MKTNNIISAFGSKYSGPDMIFDAISSEINEVSRLDPELFSGISQIAESLVSFVDTEKENLPKLEEIITKAEDKEEAIEAGKAARVTSFVFVVYLLLKNLSDAGLIKINRHPERIVDGAFTRYDEEKKHEQRRKEKNKHRS